MKKSQVQNSIDFVRFTVELEGGTPFTKEQEKQIEEVLASFPELSSEYQIHISHLDGRDTMRIYVETNGSVDFAEMSKNVADRVKSKIGFTPLVKVVELGILPRSEKKSKRVFDERYD